MTHNHETALILFGLCGLIIFLTAVLVSYPIPSASLTRRRFLGVIWAAVFVFAAVFHLPKVTHWVNF